MCLLRAFKLGVELVVNIIQIKEQNEGHTGTCPMMDAYPLAPRSYQTKTAASPLS